VLVVDDEPPIVEAFARMLEFVDGYAVRTALWGVDALHEVATQPPDVILLDIRMPHMDGVEFLRALRQRDPGRAIPVGVVTGDLFLPEDVVDELRTLGAVIRYKPMWADGLVELISELLDRRLAL